MVPVRYFSNFAPLDDEGNLAQPVQEKKYYRPYDPNRPEPEIDPQEMQRMQQSLHKFSQAMSLGQYRVAQIILDEHKPDIDRHFPEDHPSRQSVTNNQALLYKLNGKYFEAREMFEGVLDAYTQIYGQHHPSTINSLINLATVHKDLHEYDQAVEKYELAIEGRLQTEGDQSTEYAMAKAMAAGAYRELDQLDKAEAYLKDAYMIIAMQHGEENMTSSQILNSMGMLYKRQGKMERSQDAYERSLKLREELLGEDHPESLATRHNLAELYISWNKPEQAQEYLNINVALMTKKSEEQQEKTKKAMELNKKENTEL